MKAKEFALAQIAPYFKDPSICGISKNGLRCEYLSVAGKMCVAGKNMLHPENYTEDIEGILDQNLQRDIFKPEVVNILNTLQWRRLQNLHDNIATSKDENALRIRVTALNLFTYEELVEFANNLN